MIFQWLLNQFSALEIDSKNNLMSAFNSIATTHELLKLLFVVVVPFYKKH